MLRPAKSAGLAMTEGRVVTIKHQLENIMIRKSAIKKIIKLSALMVATVSTAYAANNFNCPTPAEIQSTDFTSPSIWIAPPIAHSAPAVMGVGLGGKEVKEFIGVEAAVVNHKRGWVCIYKSQGGLSVSEYQAKIRQIIESNRYLRKYLLKTNQELMNAQPYLTKYSKDSVIGFVGYQQGK